ncbi:MAG: ATP-binding protein, partial [Myxococcota bacterium]|nr:ATP-binding protein [Myxococcota bacterium]
VGSTIAIKVTVNAATTGDGRCWSLAIIDVGPGIPSEARSRVVEPFFQLDGSATRCHGGAGLGLAIAHRTAEAHGGHLNIEDAGEGGACLTFIMPFAPKRDDRSL